MRCRSRSRSNRPEEKQIQHSYAAVHVLLLNWENDDLGVNDEINQLHDVFRQAYGFQVERFHIPDEEPDDALADTLKDFVRRNQAPRSLLIVYYGGHGALNDSRLALWISNSQPGAAELKWYSHQRMLEDSTADVLLVLDCCHPLGGGGSVRPITGKEVFAACGFSSEAPGVGQHSFTRALIDELIKSAPQPFSTSELHHRVVNRLRGMVPDHNGEQRQTPILGILGEGGLPNTSIRLSSYELHPVNLVAVMGVTGSGKSSLINRICGRQIADVGHGQESMTKDVRHYITVVNGETMTLIDTPGFDDTYVSDREILERITTYLYDHYLSGRKLNGLLYLRDINTPRMTHTAVKNLDMFQRLCGEESLKNVVLLTTKWDLPVEHAQRHEEELTNKFWATMIKLGCSSPKRLGSKIDSSLGIADPIAEVVAPMLKYRPTFLQIQRELSKGVNLIDTLAGQYVDRDLSASIAEHKKTSESAMAQAERSHHNEIRDALTEEADAHDLEAQEAKKHRKALRKDFEKVREEEAERRDKLFAYNPLSRLNKWIKELPEDDFCARFWGTILSSAAMSETCEYIWKRQGAGKDLIQSAKKAVVSVSRK